jgi:hypothetical protein
MEGQNVELVSQMDRELFPWTKDDRDVVGQWPGSQLRSRDLNVGSGGFVGIVNRNLAFPLPRRRDTDALTSQSLHQ